MEPDTDRDIDLVIVTGAGASRAFGNPNAMAVNGTSAMPLMKDWSDSLVKKLGQSRVSAELVGLSKNLNGPEFEDRLGHFLRVISIFPELESILEPSTKWNSSGVEVDSLRLWHKDTNRTLNEAVTLIRESLYENFGSERTLPSAAARAYRSLLTALSINSSHQVVYATTNYDRIGEAALDKIGRRIDCGERSHYAPPGTQSPLVLDAEGLLGGMPRFTPVLHLHGAVGWYRQPENETIYVGGGTVYSKDQGIPVVMLPDPNKDYDADRTIQIIWAQFRQALRRAKKVIVLGHSLNDSSLVGALVNEVAPMSRIAITHLPAEDDPDDVNDSAASTVNIMRERLPHAHRIPLRFDADCSPSMESINKWNENLKEALLIQRMSQTEEKLISD